MGSRAHRRTWACGRPSHRSGARALSAIDRSEAQTAARTAIAAAVEKKGRDLRALDVGDLLGITDYFVLVSAASERQLGALAEEVERQLKDAARRPVRREGSKESGWVLIDYGDVVVHVFSEDQRSHYGLDRLWADAPELALDDALHAS